MKKAKRHSAMDDIKAELPTSPEEKIHAAVECASWAFLGGDLHFWQKDLAHYFELGTVYTMIAGLLNVLAIYDAYGGPLLVAAEEEDDDAEKQKQGRPATT